MVENKLTKEDIVKIFKHYYTNKLNGDNAIQLIKEYCIERRKPIEKVELFLTYLIMTGVQQITICTQCALDWYKVKYNITTIFKENGNIKEVITVY